MIETLFALHMWPRAILHIDGDAFFTSCEEAIRPELKGKPLITGGERGIVACASYAAKRLGIKRGVPLHQAKTICPNLIVMPSDYETYSLFSRRMFNILRRFTPQVEEYSIDEAFADLTGMRRAFHASYEEIASRIRKAIKTVLERLTKPGVEIWRELRGESVYPVSSEEKSTYASISKTKTFAPPTSDREYLYAQLLRNLESACIKARRYGLAPRKVTAFLKKQDFDTAGLEIKLNRPSAYPLEIAPSLREQCDALYRQDELYRATGVVLSDLVSADPVQYSLFEDPIRAEKIRGLYDAVDDLSGRFGKHTLHLGASHLLEVRGNGRRGNPTVREQTRLYGETKRRHLGLPMIHVEVKD